MPRPAASFNNDFMENLIFLFLLVHPATNADRIYRYWNKDVILREYKRPEIKELTRIVKISKTEINQIIL